jgi:hypothetical protein
MLSKKITIHGDFDYNVSQALRKTVSNINMTYDINPQIVDEWINDADFKTILTDIDNKCYRDTMSVVNPTLDKLLDVTHPEIFIEEHLPWEVDQCGQILEEFSNGYIKYCNKHRYLHKEKSLEQFNNRINKDTSKEILDHFFVKKTPKEIIEEKIFIIKYNIYLDYTNAIVNALTQKFIADCIIPRYNSYLVAEADFNRLIDWLGIHKNDFREKNPSYSGSTLFVKVYLLKNQSLPKFNLTPSVI